MVTEKSQNMFQDIVIRDKAMIERAARDYKSIACRL
jgi:hypothetical protein